MEQINIWADQLHGMINTSQKYRYIIKKNQQQNLLAESERPNQSKRSYYTYEWSINTRVKNHISYTVCNQTPVSRSED